MIARIDWYTVGLAIIIGVSILTGVIGLALGHPVEGVG